MIDKAGGLPTHANIPASSGGTANSVNVVFGVGGDIVVDNTVYSGNVQPSAGHICSQAMTAVTTPQALDLLLQMQAVQAAHFQYVCARMIRRATPKMG